MTCSPQFTNIITGLLFGGQVITILGVLSSLCYIVVSSKEGEKFTEFYISGLEGKATNYPNELALGEEEKVTLGIINREHDTVTYQVEVAGDGFKNNEVMLVVLDQDEEWEETVGFIPDKIGNKQKVEFLLYRQGQNEAYRMLHLWVDVY